MKKFRIKQIGEKVVLVVILIGQVTFVVVSASNNKKTEETVIYQNVVQEITENSIPQKIADYNSITKLNIVSIYGDNEAYHPKVINFKERWNGYKYWMAYTPYPQGNEEYENPHIVASNNLLKWEAPNGMKNNCLDDISNDKTTKKYNSDTHLVYNDDLDRLECYWRYVDDTKNEVTIYRRWTANGIDFSNKEVFIKSKNRSLRDYVSPAIIYEDNTYKMWFVDKRTVMYMEKQDEKQWSEVKKLDLTYKSADLKTWHIDILATDKGYEMIMVSYHNELAERKTMSLYYAYSTNEVDNWSVAEKILSPTEGTAYWDNMGLYRSSMIYEDGTYIVFYSGISTDNYRGIGIVYGKDITLLNSVEIDFYERMSSSDMLELI